MSLRKAIFLALVLLFLAIGASWTFGVWRGGQEHSGDLAAVNIRQGKQHVLTLRVVIQQHDLDL